MGGINTTTVHPIGISSQSTFNQATFSYQKVNKHYYSQKLDEQVNEDKGDTEAADLHLYHKLASDNESVVVFIEYICFYFWP